MGCCIFSAISRGLSALASCPFIFWTWTSHESGKVSVSGFQPYHSQAGTLMDFMD